jgi:hypothetical protein
VYRVLGIQPAATARTGASGAGAPAGTLRAFVLAALLLLITGWGHRALVAEVDRALGQVVPPARPLASLPLQTDGWVGRDVELDPQLREAAHFDDLYLNRIYASREHRAEVAVFVGYVGRPRERLGHRPDACFVSQGWELCSQERISLRTPKGTEVPAVLYRFRPPSGFGNPMYALATYIINGHFVNDPVAFQSWNGRTAGLLGERPVYQARLQVLLPERGDSDETVRVLRDFVGRFAEPLAELMPYWQETPTP